MDKRFRNIISLGAVNMLHIFIVSLQQDVEKRETISKTLSDFNLDFTFIDAVYGRELPNEYLNYLINKSSGKLIDRGFPATPGEIGCTLSHLIAYQQILDNDLDWACILEDDAILDKRFKIFIEGFQDTGLNPKALYILGGQNGLYERQIIKSIKNTKVVGSQDFSKTIRSEQYILRTCCYLISLQLAKKIINLSETKFILADDWDYLVKNKVINRIYMSNFVDHPLDLSLSYIQKERDVAYKDSISSYKNRKSPIFSRIKPSIEWRLRLLFLNCYKHIEVKDKSY